MKFNSFDSIKNLKNTLSVVTILQQRHVGLVSFDAVATDRTMDKLA